ncbi:MAG TPA: MFS transporter [Methanosarcinales archaeon]|nr:MFS transporter [Methanosarcinales archaeon]
MGMTDRMAEKSIFRIRHELYVLTGSLFFGDFGTGILMPLIPLYIKHLDAGMSLDLEIKSALAFGVFGLFAATSYPLMGRLSDRIDRRKPFVLAGLIGFMVLSAACAIIDTFEQLLAIRVAQGVMVGVMGPSVLAMLTHVSTPDNRGRSMGVYSTIRGIGSAAGPAAGGVISVVWGFGAGFYTCAVLGLISIILVGLFVKETRSSGFAWSRTGCLSDQPDSAGSVNGTANTDIRLLASAAFTTMLAIMIIATILPLYEVRLGASTAGLGIALAAYFSARLIFQTPMGMLSDMVGTRRVMVAGLGMSALLLVWMAHIATTPEFLVLMFATGVAAAAVNTPALAFGADLSCPDMVGQQMSLFPMASAIGMVVGPLIGGVFASYLGFASPFYLCAGLMVSIGVMVMTRGR